MIENYIFSLFSFIDFVTMSALFIDMLEYSQFIQQYHGGGEEFITHLGNLTILRSIRIGNFGCKLIQLINFNIEKLLSSWLLWKTTTGEDSNNNNNSSSSKTSSMNSKTLSHISVPYGGIKGYEDDGYLFQYIKDKFMFAFHESEDEGKVVREEFTMMLRNLLGLELDLEEEDVNINLSLSLLPVAPFSL